MWNIVKEKEKQDKPPTVFEDTLKIYEKNVCSQNRRLEDFGHLLKRGQRHHLPSEPPPMFAATETNVADDAIEVAVDSTAPGSSRESGNKRDHKKETLALNKLQTELGEIHDKLASYACTTERTGLSDEYKKRVEALTSKKNEVKKRLKRKMQDVQSQ